MSTSGVTTESYTGLKLVKAALRKIGVVSRMVGADPEDIEEGLEALNLMLKTLSGDGDGAANAKFWLRKKAALILSRDKNQYTIGGSASDLAVPFDTLIIRDITNAASLTAGTSELKATINEDFTVDHKVAIHYNDAGLFTSDISSFSADSNVLDEPAFDATGDWTTGTGWSITGGAAVCDNSQSAASNLAQATKLTSATRYIVLTNVSAYTSGNLTPVLGSTRGAAITATGWNLQFITASGTDFTLEADSNFDGSVTYAICVPLTSALTFTLEDSFNRPATSADEVFFYTDTIDKPVKIFTMSRRDRNGTDEDDSPMIPWTMNQYEALADKDSEGDPIAWYAEEHLSSWTLYLDAISDDMRDILVFKYRSPIELFTSSSDEIFIADDGQEMLVYNLAVRLAPEHGKEPRQSVASLAGALWQRWAGDDVENLNLGFEPDRPEFSGEQF